MLLVCAVIRDKSYNYTRLGLEARLSVQAQNWARTVGVCTKPPGGRPD